ncbi:MAG TPA: tetratricopeptide repeat protein [Blastocatellia bacterium]|nr:tetratricopeptide repeat protein [Blastocatellia bacterium]
MHRYHLLVAILLTVLTVPANVAGQSLSASEAADALYGAQKWAEAAAAYEAITKSEPQNARAWYRLGFALQAAGKFAPAVAAYHQAVEINHHPVAMYNLACAYARLGDKDRAFEWLTKSLNAGFPNPARIHSDTDLAGLRDEARFKEVAALADRLARPCEALPEYKQFDFWVGSWNVEDTQGHAVGTNVISRLEQGCVLMENWTGLQGGTGKSLNFYDAASHRWRQTWVSSTGNVNEYQGELKDGAMRFEGKLSGRGGSGTTLLRLTFFNLGPDRVRQFSEASADGGKTWSVNYDFIYVRKTS